jgi:hypothetical protein
MANKAKTSKAAAATYFFAGFIALFLKPLKDEGSKNNKALMPGKSLHEVPHVSKRNNFDVPCSWKSTLMLSCKGAANLC